MNSELFDIYIPRDGTDGIYLTKPQFSKLSTLLKDAEQLSTVIGEFCVLSDISEDDGNNGLFGVDCDGIIYGDPYHIRLAIHSTNDIHTYDSELHQKCFFQDKINDGGFAPFLHILEDQTIDFFSDKENSFESKHPNSPRFWRIMDSGIWNYLVKSHEDFVDSINNIVSNWNAGYYNLAISHEYADLNSRLTRQSFLTGGSGHGADVSPFLYHSESITKNSREKKEKEAYGTVYDLNQYKWRVLLLDDRIKNTSYLTTVPDSLKSKFHITKESILVDRIETMLGKGSCQCVYLSDDKKTHYSIDSAFNSVENNESTLVILCVDTIEKAEYALKNYQFDFILLDYLLKKSKEDPRSYGYQLLKKLDDTIDKDNSNLTPYSRYYDGEHFIVGPDHRYYFMFISAFTTAISERLRLSGWSRSEELWHIAEGACPTNTPQLFLYNLRKMMIKRIKDSGIEHLSARKIYDLVNNVYGYQDKELSGPSVRKRANDNYHSLLSLSYYYKRILNDVDIPGSNRSIFTTRGSVLMTSFILSHVHFGGLLEHLINLVHLTAFGTVRQWPEMWEEFLYFKAQFKDLYEIEKGSFNDLNATQTDCFSSLCDSIQNYILKLKSL